MRALRTLNLVNASYHSVPNLSSTRLLPKNLIKTHKTQFRLYGFHGCETWSLLWREQQSESSWEQSTRIFGESCVIKSFITCALHQTHQIDQVKGNETGMGWDM
jgi:hypothetical protein